jgi:hypothetical protein
LRWKRTSQDSWAERLFGPNIVVEIKQAAKIKLGEKERFLSQTKNCEEEFGLLQFKLKKINF